MKPLTRFFLVALFLFSAMLAAAQAPAKAAPTAKTPEESDDYNKATSVSGGAASAQAADDFSTKYPDSELRVFLYAKALHDYQAENNSAKMREMGEKVLTLDKDNIIALVMTSVALSGDLPAAADEKKKAVDEVHANAKHAIDGMDANFAAPDGATPDQITAYKNTFLSLAHLSIGTVALKTDSFAEAETELKQAAALNRDPSNVSTWYLLALAQDHLNKFKDGIATCDQAIKMAAAGSQIATSIASERDRLVKLDAQASKPKPKPRAASKK